MRKLMLLAAATLVLAGCPAADERSRPSLQSPPQATIDAAPKTMDSASRPQAPVSLEILDFDGIQRLIESHRGQVVVLDAWSTSCAPCVKEFPRLVALSRRSAPAELACISLSFDYEGIGKPEEQAPRVRKFLEAQQAAFENVLSSEESDVLYRKLGLTSIPAVYVYDRTGKLRRRFDNENARGEADFFNYDDVGQLVDELLAEKPAE